FHDCRRSSRSLSSSPPHPPTPPLFLSPLLVYPGLPPFPTRRSSDLDDRPARTHSAVAPGREQDEIGRGHRRRDGAHVNEIFLARSEEHTSEPVTRSSRMPSSA